MKQTLREEVYEIINDYVEDGYTRENFLEDLQQGGCVSGMVSELTYYDDTVEFYERHKREIGELLTEILDDSGISAAQLFGDKWDKADPLANDALNKNLLAWFAFETIALDTLG